MMIKPLQQHDADCSFEVQILQNPVPDRYSQTEWFLDVFYLFIHGILTVSSLPFISNLFSRDNLFNMSTLFSQIYVIFKDLFILFMELYSLFSRHHIYLFETCTTEYVYLSHIVDKYSGLSDVFFFKLGSFQNNLSLCLY